MNLHLAEIAIAIAPGAHGVLLLADSDDSSHRFRSKAATCSDRSQPGIPIIPAGSGARRERMNLGY
jgi:hypothetical protein